MQVSAQQIEDILRTGAAEIVGLLPGASNYTFAATVTKDDLKMMAVYKPQAGEIPLWDFPDGTLYRREIAAYLVSNALGWDLVPPTVECEGPEGIGSMQLYIDHHGSEHYFSLMTEHADVFRRVAAFDVVLNNADRKSGHCLLEKEIGRIWIVDHGVCFHPEPKLRTVIWDFAGEPLSPDVVRDLSELDPHVLDGFLHRREVDALRRRIDELLDAGIFPNPPEDRRSYPWPPV